MKLIANLKWLILLSYVQLSCSSQGGLSVDNNVTEATIYKGFNIIKITDEKMIPVPGASVEYFFPTTAASNVLSYTNANGESPYPPSWNSNFGFKVNASGFVPIEINGVPPQGSKTVLVKTLDPLFYSSSGSSNGYGSINIDSDLDLAIVVPQFSLRDLISFDIGNLFSPENSTVTISGKDFYVANNIILPTQTKLLTFIPTNITKNNYRFYNRKLGTQNVVALRGKLPLTQTFNSLINHDPIWKLLLNIQFQSIGLNQITLQTTETINNLSVNSVSLSKNIQVSSPTLNPSHFMGAVIFKEDSGLYSPTSGRTFENSSETKSIMAPAAGRLKILSFTEKKDLLSFSTSIALEDLNSLTYQPQFLDLILPPVVTASTLTTSPPSALPGLQVLATYVKLEKITDLSNPLRFEKKDCLWEYYTFNWINTFIIPPHLQTLPTGKYRWTIIYLAQPIAASILKVDDFLINASHRTQSSTDIIVP